MSNPIAQELIQKYFEDLINHHKSIFGLNEKSNITSTNYIAIHEEIFAFVNVLRQIDAKFEDDFLDTCLEDIINLVQFINTLCKDNETASLFIQTELTKIGELSKNKEELAEMFKKEFKLNKNILIHLLNTKFFYLDKYIWHKINESHDLRQLLKIKNLRHINKTLDYLKHARTKTSYMVLDYSSFQVNLHKTYNQKDIDFVKTIHHEEIQKENDPAIEQLIRYKNKIPFFKNIADSDIRDIVKDVRFLHCREHEILIKEFDTSQEIYFLVKGECRVSFRQRALGNIFDETIFGEFSFITKQPRSATVKTNKDSIIISFQFRLEAFEDNPCLYSQLYKNISEQLVKKIYTMNKEHISL